MTTFRVAFLLVLSVVIPSALSVTYTAGKANIRPVFQPKFHMVRYCLHAGTNEEWKMDETRVENCFRCTCSVAGLNCNGIGYQAGVSYQEGCTSVNLENCCYQMVSVENKDVKCGEPICPANE